MPTLAAVSAPYLPTEPTVCMGSTDCAPLSTLVQRIRTVSSWMDLIPANVTGMNSHEWECGPAETFCMQQDVRASLRRSAGHPGETFKLIHTIDRIEYITGNLDYKASYTESRYSDLLKSEAAKNFTSKQLAHLNFRLGWVPALISGGLRFGEGWRLWHERANNTGRKSALPCSTCRGEDAAVIRSFFSDFETGEPLLNGTFLEIGGFDGLTESTTLIMEGCLGWRGALIEAQPTSFRRMRKNRGGSMNIHMAACQNATTVQFMDTPATFAKLDPNASQGPRRRTVSVPCAPAGDVLVALGMSHLDFASIDVEGAELTVLRSLLSTAISIGVATVEVRSDGNRRAEMEILLGAGMSYVGQVYSRPTWGNDIIDDVYINFTHMENRFPRAQLRHARMQPGAHQLL